MTPLAVADCGVRQLYARYADAVWRRDPAAFVDCFTADGEWKIAGHHLRGREEIAGGFARFMAPSERVLMLVGATVLGLADDGSLSGRTPVTERIRLADGRGVRTIGVYHERYQDEGDRWRFRRRHWSLHYYGAPDLSGPFFESSDYGPPPGMPGPDEPTLVRRDG
jgi:uncharacterized protein (TIGR02246 family)